MTGYVVDASVAVKWMVTETFSDQAAQLLDKNLTLIAPEFLFAEATNALWAMCRRGDITKADFAEATEVLKSHPSCGSGPDARARCIRRSLGGRSRSPGLRLLLLGAGGAGAISCGHG